MTDFDLDGSPLRELNQFLHGNPTPHVNIHNPNGRHNIAVGVDAAVDIEIDGHVGYYCGGMNKQADIIVQGNAGPAIAENMMSGSVRVKGNASQYAGASGHGGTLTIEGDASARCGISMKGIDIVVAGNVGHMCGFMAQKGHLVICGNAGDYLGDSLYEAVIYVQGETGVLGADCVEKEMTPDHRQKLSKLLASAGLDHDPGQFKRFGSARILYHFDVDNADAY